MIDGWIAYGEGPDDGWLVDGEITEEGSADIYITYTDSRGESIRKHYTASIDEDERGVVLNLDRTEFDTFLPYEFEFTETDECPEE